MTNLIAISDVRKDLPTLVERIYKTDDRVVITQSGKPKAAIVSIEELEALEETAEVLSLHGVKESIEKGINQAKKRQGVSFSSLK